MKRILLIFFSLVLCGCGSALSISVPTSLSISSQETSTFLSYPPCASLDTDQLPTPSVSNGYPQKLFEGLSIEEYSTYVYDIQSKNSGCRYADRIFNDTTIDLSPSYQVVIQSIDMQSEIVKVLKGGIAIFDVKTLTYGSSGLVQAWSYDDHWVIEVKTQQGVDIIRDGQSLKKANGYDKVFAFQILDNKPFFFFNRHNIWGINYDSHEFQLNYDEISYNNIYDGMDPSVVQHQNMVIFQAKRNNNNYSVVIGASH